VGLRLNFSSKIINIASLYGLIAPSKGLQVAYTASKRGVIGLTRVNAVELMPLGIQVNAIAPGYFFTEMSGELCGTSLEQAIKRRAPSGCVGETSQLVGTCIYLASAASDHVSGICIPVDGVSVIRRFGTRLTCIDQRLGSLQVSKQCLPCPQ
jgi:2-dehydro-3-deoxy-D-gluconate 5-dehydrogenase